MNNQNQNQREPFSWWKKIFFPVYPDEFQRVIIFAITFCGIVFIYTTCRQLKDVLMLQIGGAEVIPISKVIVMISAACLGMLHSKITRKYSQYEAFLISFLPFITFFILFAVFFPYLHFVHMSSTKIQLLSTQIPYLKYFFVIVGNWVFCLYYTFSEMFSSFILTATFWQIANFYFSFNEVKRFYPFYALFAQLGSYSAGTLMTFTGCIISRSHNLNLGIIIITSAITIAAIIIIVVMTYFFKVILKENINLANTTNNIKKTKTNISWKESIKNLKDHPNLILVCLLTVWYGICATSMETYWKGLVSTFYTTSGEKMKFFGEYYQWTSIITLIITIVVAPLVRIFPWVIAALITPLVVFISSFFLFGMKYSFVANTLSYIFAINPERLFFVVLIIGALALIFFKSAKYVLFDPTKEIYIGRQKPDNIIQVKSLETFVSRFGKGGAAIIQTLILLIPGMSVEKMVPISWCVTLLIACIWILSIIRINKEMSVFEKINQ
jgi:ATP:ADP antiporter, AAA family